MKEKAQNSPHDVAAELSALRRRVAELEQVEEERRRAIEALGAREAEQRDFTRKLTVLYEVTNALNKAETFDDLCRQAAELAHFRLGFSRVGIWFLTSPGFFRGSFGISERGQVRDERMMEMRINSETIRQALAQRGRFTIAREAPLYNHLGAEVGIGAQVVAALWDGEQVIGAVSVDDLLMPGSLTERQAEILALFASALGHLCSRKRAEEERLKLETRVQHAQRLESLGVLAGGIAHDFNNLLVGILGNADLALYDLPVGAPARQNVTEILTAAKRATELTRQMLAYSGKGKLATQTINLKDVVQETASLLELSISKKITLKYELNQDMPAIEADPSQILQVVMNLITNASEAIGDQTGVVRIATGAMECDQSYLRETVMDDGLPAGRYVFVEVADTGCGIDHKTLKQIFDPFFTTKFAGRGLGLAAVLGIVRGHKGAIKVYSELGRGTTFRVLFPALNRPGGAAAPDVAKLPSFHGEGTILLVDDDKAVCAVGTRMLERMGFTVISAEDGRQALELFQQHINTIACVVLDIAMPVMSGEDTFRELRRIKSDVRVIIASGYGESDVMDRFAGKGVSGFIQKPFMVAALSAKLNEVLGTP